ncbi:AraC-like DNA-binding protein [Paenibacillus sp. DS2015]
MHAQHRRFFATSREQQLPLYMESIGFNPAQERFSRPRGYLYYHWLQTIRGEGKFTFGGTTLLMKENTGVLLLPNEPHQYEPVSEVWETMYITFLGPQVAAILSSLGLNLSSYYQWDQPSELTTYASEVLNSMASDRDVSGLDASGDLYRFLIVLKKHGRINNLPSVSHAVERLMPVLALMEQGFDDPNLGLDDMAIEVGLSARHLNTLFKQTFGMTAYAYFILYRIRKAKELMTAYSDITGKEIAQRVGFRDVSHFVATFRRIEGVTPEQFRNLY